MTPTTTQLPAIGFIGLGDHGLPMAKAVAAAGFPLHTWTGRPESPDGPQGLRGLHEAPHAAHVPRAPHIQHVPHENLRQLAAACDVVELCVDTDDEVLRLITDGLLEGLRPGSVVVNHGTGTPANARRLAGMCAAAGVEVLDAPVSGGVQAAEERSLTTLVGGPRSATQRCEPVFAAFSRHIVHLGEAGAGQTAKLFNNILMMLNQAAVAEIVDLAAAADLLDPRRLVDALKLGSASSVALTALNTLITDENATHLSAAEAGEIELFDHAMRDANLDTNLDAATITTISAITARATAGALGLPRLLRLLNQLNL
jgi:3-hydroxyisobutyrate dehydrogenase-like beta-hydroxyacid dehydrogenase